MCYFELCYFITAILIGTLDQASKSYFYFYLYFFLLSKYWKKWGLSFLLIDFSCVVVDDK